MSKRNIKLYLYDIDEAINKIDKYVKNLSFNNFVKDEKTVDAVIRNLEIIGEAASHVPEEFRSKHPKIPWYEIIGMRNKVVHEYFGVDLEILWKTIKEDIPRLKKGIEKLC